MAKTTVPLTEEQKQFAEANLGIAKWWANKMLPRYQFFKTMLEEDDVISIGYAAICRAAQGFDPSKGIKFSTYAQRCIFQAVCDQARRAQFIRKPLSPEPLPFKYVSQNIQKNEPYYDDRAIMEERDSNELLSKKVSRCLRLLSKRHREILIRRCMKGETLKQVGERIGVTKERVRQIQEDAMDQFGHLYQYAEAIKWTRC